jgi:phospholipid/cholesterol/gamma-HCH transport system permease protein
VLTPVRQVGAFVVWLARLLGALALVLARTTLSLPSLDRRELQRAVVLFGWNSMPLALGSGSLIGATVVLQAGVFAVKFGARQYTGWAAGFSLLWEMGPLLLGLVMAARIGARNAAELALLTVNGQIEGLRGISLDPFRLLVAPRVVGSTVAVAALSTLTYLLAIGCETVAAYFTLKLPVRVFFTSFSEMLHTGDLLVGVAKALVFGTAIALVSTAAGLRASGGARGVGQAAAGAVVASCGAIFALDFLLTPVLTRLFS